MNMKLTIFLIASAILMNAHCIAHAADGKEKLQWEKIKINVSISNQTDYKVKAHLKKHHCVYDINKNRNFDLAPGAVANVRAEIKNSGGCFFGQSYMVYEFTVAVPNISPIQIGECRIISLGSFDGYGWSCSKQRVSDFYFGASPPRKELPIYQSR